MPAPKLPALDPRSLPMKGGTLYPAAYRALVEKRERARLGEALGLKNFGVNLLRLPPGAGSSQRHWHTKQDEFVYVIEGEVTLITDGGEQTLGAGMCAGFPAGKPDGHHLINRSARDALILEVGDRMPGDEGRYPEADMLAVSGQAWKFTRKDGGEY
jgi:uncharacterized cupin superfamily protein